MRDHRHRRRAAPARRSCRGLERLEYRGYDSAGIVARGGRRARRRARKVGKVEQLRAVAGSNGSPATTRHGAHPLGDARAASERNAHPFVSNDGRFAVLMNGIFENYLASCARRWPRRATSSPRTPTPRRSCTWWPTPTTATWWTPCAATFAPGGPLRVLRGVAARPATMIVGARLACPLVVGVGEGETFIASDAVAFLEETRRVQHVREGEVVRSRPRAHASRPSRAARSRATSEAVDLGRRGRREGRLRDVHAQGDPRAAHAHRATPSASACATASLQLDDIGLTDAELLDIDRVLHRRLRHRAATPASSAAT